MKLKYIRHGEKRLAHSKCSINVALTDMPSPSSTYSLLGPFAHLCQRLPVICNRGPPTSCAAASGMGYRWAEMVTPSIQGTAWLPLLVISGHSIYSNPMQNSLNF